MKKIALLCGLVLAVATMPAQAETMRYDKTGHIAEAQRCLWAEKNNQEFFVCLDGGPSQADIHDYPGWKTLFNRCANLKKPSSPVYLKWLNACEARAFIITRYNAAHGIIPDDKDRVFD